MLNNFIYAQSKAMFEEQLAEVPIEAIVFIEDTKEIWTHGQYFDCSTLDPNIIPSLQMEIDELRANADNKADATGTYPNMTVGTAEDLGGRPFVNDAEFAFRATAGANNSIKDGMATITSIKGQSVIWNNHVSVANLVSEVDATFDPVLAESTIIEFNPSGTVSSCMVRHPFNNYVPGRKYGISFDIRIDTTKNLVDNYWVGYFRNPTVWIGSVAASDIKNKWHHVWSVIETDPANFSHDAIVLGLYEYHYLETKVQMTPADTIKLRDIQVVDLTLMFGAGNEPTTYEEYLAKLPITTHKYDEVFADFMVSSFDKIKTVGDNLFDKDSAERGYVENDIFYPADWSQRFGYVTRCLPNTEYYFKNAMNGYFLNTCYFYTENMSLIEGRYVSDNGTIEASTGYITSPEGAYYMRIMCNEAYLDSCMVSLVHSGWKAENAEYQPYWSNTVNFSQLTGLDELRAVGDVCDELRYNKATQKWEYIQRVGAENAEVLSWNDWYDDGFRIYAELPNKAPGLTNIACNSVYAASNTTDSLMLDVSIAGNANDNNIYLKNSNADSYDDFVDMLVNEPVIIYYELATPIITELDVPAISYKVADFGTEEVLPIESWMSTMPFKGTIEYGFNANDTVRNNKLDINKLYNKVTLLEKKIAQLEAQLTTAE